MTFDRDKRVYIDETISDDDELSEVTDFEDSDQDEESGDEEGDSSEDDEDQK